MAKDMTEAKINLSDIKKEYDVIVVGGGITGAGVFHEAVQRGYSVLLQEAICVLNYCHNYCPFVLQARLPFS